MMKKKHDDAAQDKALISKMIKSSEKKEPMKLAAGGVAKLRRGFPMTKGKK